MRRLCLFLFFGLLLAVAGWRSAAVMAFQSAVPYSWPGHEDLTFWVNHNGLEQIDVEGEVGYGDMGRILMRRRANSDRIRALRDRFVFAARDFDKLDVPDLSQTRFVVAQNRIFNLPEARGGKGYFHKVVEREPGVVTRVAGGREITFDVRPLAHLRVRIVDERGRPATARVYLTGSDGLGYAPRGTISRFTAMSAEQFFHARERFEIDLPAGDTLIEAVRGPEYEMTRQSVTLAADKPTDITIRLKRWTDMSARGFYSSDAHIHANYTAPHHQTVTAEDVLDYTLGEDLNLPNMMVANSSGAFLHDTRLFTGNLHPLSRGNYLIRWNEEMRNAGLYGHMCLYGLRSLVEPIYTGFRDTPFAEDYPSNYTQARATARQGGAVTYAHPGYEAAFETFSARELPVDAALGVVDAMDVMSNNPEDPAMDIWYRLLNAGVRLAVSAGSDSFTNVADHYVPGGGRVYAKVSGGLTYDGWLAAYKRGRSFATNGPMLWLTVEGKEPGDELRLPAGARTVRVDVEMQSHLPADTVELVVNGKAISPPPKTLHLERSSWIAARVKGPWHRLVLNDAYLFAHTSPVYVVLGNQPIVSADDARFFVDWIDKLIQRTEQRGRFSSPGKKREVVELFQKARALYQEKAASTPAAARLHPRMPNGG